AGGDADGAGGAGEDGGDRGGTVLPVRRGGGPRLRGGPRGHRLTREKLRKPLPVSPLRLRGCPHRGLLPPMTATTSLTRTMRVSLLEGLLRGAVVDPEVARAVDENPTAVNELGYDPWGFHPET